MRQSIFKNEKELILDELWKIINREVRYRGGVSRGIDTWVTSGAMTYIRADKDYAVSNRQEVADIVNAINALQGCIDRIDTTVNREVRR